MSSSDTAYFFISAGFVIVVNLIALFGLGQSFKITRKLYLALACTAAIVEIFRQVPDTLLVNYPESNRIYLASFLLQFSASLILLGALLRFNRALQKRDKFLLGSLTLIYLSAASFQWWSGLPDTTLAWYLVSSPGILAALAIVGTAIRIPARNSSGRNLLVLSSMALVLSRIWLPAITSLDLLYLIYYMEVLLFPIVLTGLNLTEVEFAYKKVQNLLEEKTQSEKDLQFILDHSLDIILISDNIGLLLTWNKRAESMFGFNAAQAIGNIHIDELFFGNYSHKNVDEFDEFESTMENIDGGTFPVRVRIKTVYRDESTYSIYVINADPQKKLAV